MNNFGQVAFSFFLSFLFGVFGVIATIIWITIEKSNLKVQNCLIASLLGFYFWWVLIYN